MQWLDKLIREASIDISKTGVLTGRAMHRDQHLSLDIRLKQTHQLLSLSISEIFLAWQISTRARSAQPVAMSCAHWSWLMHNPTSLSESRLSVVGIYSEQLNKSNLSVCLQKCALLQARLLWNSRASAVQTASGLRPASFTACRPRRQSRHASKL